MIETAILLPLLLSVPGYYAEKKKKGAGLWLMLIVCAAVAALLAARLLSGEAALLLPQVCGFGLRFAAEGFRALYALVAAVLWLFTSAMSPEYFAHHKNTPRYVFFTLVTLSATVGLLLSDSLMTAYVCFEVMSLFSYPWVAQEETSGALDAAKTYLYIALIGGMVLLMGLFLLPEGAASLPLGQLSTAAASMSGARAYVAGGCMLFGFGAKAGLFPLHIWLPKAHPVAPAPASALLSGILTKTGVFGVILIVCQLLAGDRAFGVLVLLLGAATMLLGALKALFSVDLKRVLACSSLSQIGFVLVGVGCVALCPTPEGAMTAAYGAVGHMVNHSLFKLVLFLCAGAVYMNRHTLDLTELRGAGRGSVALHFSFLVGLLGISGVPLFAGYVSKTLLHEGILAAAQSLKWLRAVEAVFLLSGGLTLCYMLKLYITLFWLKPEGEQAPLRLSLISRLSFALPALALLAMGVLDGGSGAYTLLGGLSLPFFGLGQHAPETANALAEGLLHWHNLRGAGISLLIGAALYLLVTRPWLMPGGRHIDRWPAWLDMESRVYVPLLRLLDRLGYAVAHGLDWLADSAIAWLVRIGKALAGLLGGLTDNAVVLARRLLRKRGGLPDKAPVGTRATYAAGMALNRGAAVLNHTLRRRHPLDARYEIKLAATQEELSRDARRVTRSFSFGLLLFCAGLLATLAYLLLFL